MILRSKRQTIPIVCIVHFIITQYKEDSKQKFSRTICHKEKTTCGPVWQQVAVFLHAEKIRIILMHIRSINAPMPVLVKKHFRHRLSIHSP